MGRRVFFPRASSSKKPNVSSLGGKKSGFFFLVSKRCRFHIKNIVNPLRKILNNNKKGILKNDKCIKI